MILSVTKYGCFVELDNLFIEGLAPIASLLGDHYTYRENTRQIMGEYSGRRYSMGDRVRVVLERVDAVERRLQFSILEEVAPIGIGRPGKRKPKEKAAKKKPAKRGGNGRDSNLPEVGQDELLGQQQPGDAVQAETSS